MILVEIFLVNSCDMKFCKQKFGMLKNGSRYFSIMTISSPSCCSKYKHYLLFYNESPALNRYNGVSQNCFKSFQDKNSNKTFKFIPFFSYTRLVPGSEAIIEIIGRNRKVKIGSQLDICR